MENFTKKLWDLFEKAMKFILYNLFKLKISESSWNAAIQFTKFGIVGLSNTLISYLIYAVTLEGIRLFKAFPKYDYFIAQFIAFILSVAWSFYWNNRFVFKEKEGENRNILFSLLKTYASYAFTSLFMSELLLILWVNILGISEYIAPILNLLITVPLNFIIQKLWAFKDNSKKIQKAS